MSAVFVGMMLGRFGGVVGSVLSVPVRYMSVVTGLLVIPALMMLGSFTMVFRCVLVMFSRLVMMLCTFVCHFIYVSMSSFAGQSSLQQSQYTPPGGQTCTVLLTLASETSPGPSQLLDNSAAARLSFDHHLEL
jgi:hypothetical protein